MECSRERLYSCARSFAECVDELIPTSEYAKSVGDMPAYVVLRSSYFGLKKIGLRKAYTRNGIVLVPLETPRWLVVAHAIRKAIYEMPEEKWEKLFREAWMPVNLKPFLMSLFPKPRSMSRMSYDKMINRLRKHVEEYIVNDRKYFSAVDNYTEEALDYLAEKIMPQTRRYIESLL